MKATKQELHALKLQKNAYRKAQGFQTKAELKDRIAELECVVSNQREEIRMIERNLDWHIGRGKRATTAAYACLAVIFVLVVGR